MSQENGAKLLSELKVPELKVELEKRNLDQRGIKLILADRLEKALKAEGHDPTTYRFEFEAGDGEHKENNGDAVTSTSEGLPNAVEESAPVEESCDTAAIDVSAGEADLVVDEGEAVEDVHEEPMDTTGPVPASSDEPAASEENKEVEKVAEVAKEEADKPAEEGEEQMEHDPVDEEAEAKKQQQEAHGVSLVAEEPKKQENGERVEAVLAKKVEESDVKKDEGVNENDNKEEDEGSTNQRSVWVRNLAGGTKAAELKALFATCGRVVRAKIFTSKKTATAVAFGFVTMHDKAEVDIAIEKLNKKDFKGKPITMERADKSRLPTAKASSGATVIYNDKKESEARKEKPVRKDDRKERERRREEVKERKKEGEKKEADNKDERKESAKEEKKDGGRSKERPRREHRTSDRNAPERRSRVAPASRGAYRGVADRSAPTTRYYTTASYRGSAPRTRGAPFMSSRGGRGIAARVSYPGTRGPGGGILSRVSRGPSAMDALGALSSRQVEELLRLKEEEHRRRERDLELERERERIRFEKEKLERKRLELQLLAAQQQAAFAVPSLPIADNTYPTSSGSHRAPREYNTTSSRGGSSRHTRVEHHSRERVAARTTERHADARSREPRTVERREAREPHPRSTSHHHDARSVQVTRDRDSRDARTARDNHRAGARDRSRSDYTGHGSATYSTSAAGGRVYETSGGRQASYASSAREYSSSSSYPREYATSGLSSTAYSKEYASSRSLTSSLPYSSSSYGTSGSSTSSLKASSSSALSRPYEWQQGSSSLGGSSYSKGSSDWPGFSSGSDAARSSYDTTSTYYSKDSSRRY